MGSKRRAFRTKDKWTKKREIKIWRSCRYVLGQKVEEAKLKMQIEAGLEVALNATLNFCPIDNGCSKAPHLLQLGKTPAPASISAHKSESCALKDSRATIHVTVWKNAPHPGLCSVQHCNGTGPSCPSFSLPTQEPFV